MADIDFHKTIWTAIFYSCLLTVVSMVFPTIHDVLSYLCSGHTLSRILGLLFTWQAVAYLALLVFAQPVITTLVRGLKVNIGKDGVLVDLNSTAEKQQTHPQGDELWRGLDNIPITPPLAAEIDEINNDIAKRISPPNPELTKGLLIKHLAFAKLYMRCGEIYRLIFGSQIATLRFLHANGATEKQELLRFYNEAIRTFPEQYKGYSAEAWFSFLENQKLIQRAGDLYHSTAWTTFFLAWMLDERVPDNKTL